MEPHTCRIYDDFDITVATTKEGINNRNLINETITWGTKSLKLKFLPVFEGTDINEG